MHIAEGMLSAPYALGYSLGAGAFVAAGIAHLKTRTQETPMVKQLTGVLTAGVFLISLLPIPVPLTGTSSHPGGTPLAAILLGPWITALISFIALLFQALFFGHGGLTTLGANVLSMGGLGGMISWLVFWGIRKVKGRLFLAAFLAAFLGDLMIYLGTSVQLALALHGAHPVGEVFYQVVTVFIPTQVPLAILEGLFTGFVLQYVEKNRPDILRMLKILKVYTKPFGQTDLGRKPGGQLDESQNP